MKSDNLFFEKLEDQLMKKGYIRKNVTFTPLRATLLGSLYALPFVALLVFIYRFILFERVAFSGAVGIVFYVMFLSIIIISVCFHELLHGIGWTISSKKGWGIIKFNFNAFTPSCTCTVPLRKKSYLIGVLMPIIILGVFSMLFLIIYPSDISFLTAVVNYIIAGADLLIAFNVMKEKDVLIIDHPIEPGYIAFFKNDKESD